MKAKKSKKADVERFRGLFFRLGLVISILCVVFAFKWTTFREVIEFDTGSNIFVPEPVDPIIRIKKEEPKPKQVVLEIVEKEPIKDPAITDIFIVDPGKNDSIPEIPIFDIPEKDPDPVPEFFIPIEDRPKFPGGENAMFKFLGKNIVYPELEKEMGIQGLVTLHFIVNKDGSLSEVGIVKGVSPNIDAEAIRVVESMPNWIPGKQRDRKVAVTISMPIRFTLAY